MPLMLCLGVLASPARGQDFVAPLPALRAAGTYFELGTHDSWDAAEEAQRAQPSGSQGANQAVALLGRLEPAAVAAESQVATLRVPPAQAPGPAITAILHRQGKAQPPGPSPREWRLRTSIVAGGVAAGLFGGGALLALSAEERPFTDSRGLIAANNTMLVGSGIAAATAAGLFTWAITTPGKRVSAR